MAKNLNIHGTQNMKCAHKNDDDNVFNDEKDFISSTAHTILLERLDWQQLIKIARSFVYSFFTTFLGIDIKCLDREHGKRRF